MVFFPVIAIKTRLRSYRTMFRRTYNLMPSGSGGLDMDVLSSPKKELLKMLWFLKDHLRTQLTYSNLKSSSSSPEEVILNVKLFVKYNPVPLTLITKQIQLICQEKLFSLFNINYINPQKSHVELDGR